MLASLLIVLPVFGLIGIGTLARQIGLVGDKVGEGLSDYVFALAVPCLIFRTLTRADIPVVQPWGYWISYFAGVAVVWWLAMIAAGLSGTSAVVAGFSAGQANTVLVGIPMILEAYGEAGAVPLFLLIAVHLPVTMTLATVLAEGWRTKPLAILHRLATHPIILAILAGTVLRPVAGIIPGLVWELVDAIGGTAAPCSLVAMGLALRRYGLQAGLALPSAISALKLLVHPLLVFILATQVFDMPAAWSGVAVLFAACPCGVNAYPFAVHYGEAVPLASSAVALSTILALGTLILWLRVLGVG